MLSNRSLFETVWRWCMVAQLLNGLGCHLVWRYTLRPRPHCVRWGPSSQKRGTAAPPPLFDTLLWHSRPSEQCWALVGTDLKRPWHTRIIKQIKVYNLWQYNILQFGCNSSKLSTPFPAVVLSVQFYLNVTLLKIYYIHRKLECTTIIIFIYAIPLKLVLFYAII